MPEPSGRQQSDEQRARRERMLDRTIESTFPASDPLSSDPDPLETDPEGMEEGAA
jgi:hypothetical protein